MNQSNYKNPQHSNRSSLHTDSRLHQIAPDRLEELIKFANELSSAPQDQKMAVFLSIQQRARQNQMAFSNDEKQLLLNVLTEQMTPDEKHRVELIQKLASKLSSSQ